jgi:putative membrane protein
MAVVAAQNMRMLRSIATLYGARPGTIGLFRLARMVLAHIVLTGGIALGDDLIQQLIGHRLVAKLSARLGEGLFNGALTARIGLAAIEVCRPLPFIEVKQPRLRDLVAEIALKKTAKSPNQDS